MNRFLSFLARMLAGFVTRGFFRGFEVIGEATHEGPRLIVANHFNGFVDAVVLVRALGGLPHFIAKSTLFDQLPLRLLLRLLGVIPVYRRVDHADVTANQSSFDEVEAALAKGQTVLIFPEGTVTDAQQLQTVRTGAARIVLGAMARGVRDIAIIPMGITYEDKVAARSRVLVEIGERIDADTELPPLTDGGDVSSEDHALVRATTHLIRDRLAAVSPEYGSLIRERVMMSAGEIHLRAEIDSAYAEPPLSRVRAVAQRLANLPDSELRPVIDAVGRYELALAAVGLRDDQISPPPRWSDLTRLVARKLIILLIILPLAFVGLVANLVPTLIVLAVGAFVREPVTKGTARVLTALVVFPVSWTLLVVLADPDRVWITLIVVIVGSVLLVVLIQQVLELAEAAVTYSSVRNRRWLIPDLDEFRDRANDVMSRALEVPDLDPNS